MTFGAAKALERTRIDAGKTLAVVGGTNGIGKAMALKFAALGVSRIILVGRNAERAGEVQKACEAAVPDGVALETQFVKADLSTRAAMRDCAASLAAAAPSGLDYLVLCQNGVPLKTDTLNADGDQPAFAVQAISRFVISQTLVERGVLNTGAVVVSVCNPGNSLDSLDAHNLSLRGIYPTCRTTVGWFMTQSFRDSSVIDAFMFEQNKRFPQYRFFHIYPGMVGSENFNYDAFPFPINWATWAFDKAGLMTSPKAFAAYPVYVALYPDEAEKLAGGRFMGYRLGPAPPGKWAQVEANRLAVWDQFEKIIKE